MTRVHSKGDGDTSQHEVDMSGEDREIMIEAGVHFAVRSGLESVVLTIVDSLNLATLLYPYRATSLYTRDRGLLNEGHWRISYTRRIFPRQETEYKLYSLGPLGLAGGSSFPEYCHRHALPCLSQ